MFVTHPENTKVRYQKLNEPPYSFDGHIGFSFQIPAREMPEILEVHQVSKMGSRKDIFEKSLKIFNPNADDLSFEENYKVLTTLFVLYVCEINKVLGPMENMQMTMFADDMLLSLSGKNHTDLHAKASRSVDKLCEIVAASGMSLVAKKSVVSIYGKEYKKNLNPKKLAIMGTEIEYSSDMKYLGSYFTSKNGEFCFEKIDEVLIGKCRGVVQRLRSINSFMFAKGNALILRSLLKSLIRSVMHG